MEKLWVPETVRRLFIYADNDAHAGYDGQASAYLLARRLRKQGGHGGMRHIEVILPSEAGCDWADVWSAQHDPAPQPA